MSRIKGLTDEEYRALPIESYSSLKSLLSSPEAFLKHSSNPFTGNEYTDLGTAVHNLLQELPQEKELSSKTKDVLVQISNNFSGNKLIGEFEVAFKTTFKGMIYKGKVDIYDKHTKTIGEIKTSSKAVDLKSFRKEAYSRDYDLQAAMYLQMTGCKSHYFVVANTVEPFQVKIYPTSKDFIKSGYLKLEKIVKEYHKMFNGVEDAEETV